MKYMMSNKIDIKNLVQLLSNSMVKNGAKSCKIMQVII